VLILEGLDCQKHCLDEVLRAVLMKNHKRNPINIEKLSARNFAPFGEVIEVSDKVKNYPINYGNTQRYNDLGSIDTGTDGGETIVSIFRSTPLAFPLKIEIMERHPLGSQLFFPLNQHPYLVIVAPAGPLDEAAIKLFLARPDQGVNYHKGTWHHYSLALESVSDFIVVDRKGPGNNLDEAWLQKPFIIDGAGFP